jgi:hypothetical protein
MKAYIIGTITVRNALNSHVTNNKLIFVIIIVTRAEKYKLSVAESKSNAVT